MYRPILGPYKHGTATGLLRAKLMLQLALAYSRISFEGGAVSFDFAVPSRLHGEPYHATYGGLAETRLVVDKMIFVTGLDLYTLHRMGHLSYFFPLGTNGEGTGAYALTISRGISKLSSTSSVYPY